MRFLLSLKFRTGNNFLFKNVILIKLVIPNYILVLGFSLTFIEFLVFFFEISNRILLFNRTFFDRIFGRKKHFLVQNTNFWYKKGIVRTKKEFLVQKRNCSYKKGIFGTKRNCSYKKGIFGTKKEFFVQKRNFWYKKGIFHTKK